jgi:hypothetical protein
VDAEIEREISRLDKRVGAVEVVVTKSVAWDMEIRGLHDDVSNCREAVERVHQDFRRYKEDERERRDMERDREQAQRDIARKERKRDRWTYIATVISALAVMATVVSIVVTNT